MKQLTNTEFITELMDFSANGPLMHAFVLEGLRIYAQHVTDHPEQLPENGFISRAAWVRCADEVLEKLEARNA